MPSYFVDDGGSSTSPYDTWAKAAPSFAALVSGASAALTTSGNIIYVGHDHNDAGTGAAKTYVGPDVGLPVIIISADREDTGATPAYRVGTGNQLNTTDGAYVLTLDGSFALYGIKVASGGTGAGAIVLSNDSNEAIFAQNCTFVVGANGSITIGGAGAGTRINSLTINLTADETTPRTRNVIDGINGVATIAGLTFINAGYRTGSVIQTNASAAFVIISGADFSGFTQETCEICAGPEAAGLVVFANCKTANNAPLWSAPTTGRTGGLYSMSNVAGSDNPAMLAVVTTGGEIRSTNTIYRSSGAGVEDIANTAWLVTTTAVCAESWPFVTSWMYGTVASTGSKTFTCHITNDAADFTDAEVWLEVEYLKDDGSGQWTIATDQRATITTTPVAQTDDTTSVWVGLNDDSQGLADYMQSLAVTATVGETGQYRARVAVGVASIAASRYFYIDPKITVS
jgi:hypothetical protein